MSTEVPDAPSADLKSENMTMAQLTASMSARKAQAAPGSSQPAKPAAEAGKPAPANPASPTPEPEQREAAAGDELTEPVPSNSPAPSAESAQEPGQPELETEPSAEEIPADPAASPLHDELTAAIEEAKLPKGHAKMIKRMSALVDQRDSERNRRLELETRLTDIEARLQNPETPQPTTRPPAGTSAFDPIANHPEMLELNQALSLANRSIEWLREHPDGGDLEDGKGGTTNLDADYVARTLATVTDRRTELIAQRGSLTAGLRQSVSETARKNQELALKLYPWHADRESAEHQAAEAVLRKYPALKDSPDYLLILGRLVEGQKAEATKLKPAPAVAALPTRTAAATRKPTPQPGAPAAAGARVDAPEAELKAAQEEFNRTGSEKAYSRLRIAQRAARGPQKAAA